MLEAARPALDRIPPMTGAAIDQVRALETAAMAAPQVPIVTDHLFHAGTYARTVRLPAGVLITGALIKRATLLIVNGNALAFIGDEVRELTGYNVIPASAGRKQAFLAVSSVDMTMLFATSAKCVDEAEAEFTDETDLLASVRDRLLNNVLITGE